MLVVFLPWILPNDWVISSKQSPNLPVRGTGGLVCLGVLSTACLGMLANSLLRIFPLNLGVNCYSLWW